MHHKVGLDTFPVFDKVVTNGPGSHEVFQIVKRGTAGGGPPLYVNWNYNKFLVDGDGIPVARYESIDSPTVAEGDIRALLGLD